MTADRERTSDPKRRNSLCEGILLTWKHTSTKVYLNTSEHVRDSCCSRKQTKQNQRFKYTFKHSKLISGINEICHTTTRLSHCCACPTLQSQSSQVGFAKAQIHAALQDSEMRAEERLYCGLYSYRRLQSNACSL